MNNLIIRKGAECCKKCTVALCPDPPIQNLLAVLVGVLMMKHLELLSNTACRSSPSVIRLQRLSFDRWNASNCQEGELVVNSSHNIACILLRSEQSCTEHSAQQKAYEDGKKMTVSGVLTVVSIPMTLLPCPSSVMAKQPRSSSVSSLCRYSSWCFFVPRLHMLPPHSVKCTPACIPSKSFRVL